MKLESAAVHAGKEIPAQPRNQNDHRADTKHEECNQKDKPVMETNLQQATKAVPKFLESYLKTLLQAHQWIAAEGGFLPLSLQQVLCHCWNDGPGKEIRSQHGEHYRFGERNEQVSRHARQQEHRRKHNADRKRGDEGRGRYLRCAVQNNFVQILFRSCSFSC